MSTYIPTHDYYAILGISSSATDDDIKRAYRLLIARHHPDKLGDTEYVLLINEAYETLKDPNKRTRYDALYPLYIAKNAKNPTWEQVGVAVGRLFKTAEHNFRHNLHDLRHQVKNSDAFRHARFSFSHMTEKPIGTLCASLDVAMNGGQVSFVLHGQNITTTLPQGLHDGLTIKLSIQDRSVWLSVTITHADNIRLDKKDIHRTVAIYPWQVALDEWLELSHFGQDLRVATPSLSQLSQPIKLSGYGIPATPYDVDSIAGDLYLYFNIILPDVRHLTDAQRRAFDALKDSFKFKS